MNQARRQSARPGDFSKKAGAPHMPPEVRAMARQMGIPAEELAGADGMWAKLTAMSENDPKAYAELLGESAKHVAKAQGEELAEGQEPDDAKATELMNKLLAPTSMTPTAGYVVKAALKYGGGKLMINCCAHAAVQPPRDSAGRDATDRVAAVSAQGLQIPMVVGEPRACDVAGSGGAGVGRGQAIDVVFHPWVLARCADEGPRSPFRADVSALAVRWVAAESKLAVDTATWKHISSTYKGGLGPKGDGVVPFPLDAASFQDKPPGARSRAAPAPAPATTTTTKTPTGVATSPESLLQRARAIAADVEKENDKDVGLKLRTDPKKKKKKVMIQEVGADGDVLEAGTDGFDLSAEEAKPAVKKGFLDSSAAKKKALYPEEGSTQGDSQKEGAYSRFMSKCKVVDTTTMSKDEQEAMMRKHAGVDGAKAPAEAPAPQPKAAPAPAPEPTFDAVKKGFLGGDGASKAPDLYAADEAKKRKETVYDPIFDELSNSLDPEFCKANAAANAPPDDEDETLDQLRAFADKMDFGQLYGGFGKPGGDAPAPAAEDPPPPPPPPKLPGTRPQAPDEMPRGFIEAAAAKADAAAAARPRAKPLATAVSALAAAADGKRRARVVVALDGVADLGEVDLDVGAATLRVRHGASGRKVAVALPFAAAPALAAAKFSKKKAQLTVTLTEA